MKINERLFPVHQPVLAWDAFGLSPPAHLPAFLGTGMGKLSLPEVHRVLKGPGRRPEVSWVNSNSTARAGKVLPNPLVLSGNWLNSVRNRLGSGEVGFL